MLHTAAFDLPAGLAALKGALQTRASACSSLSRVTDEPPCAKHPLWGSGELWCSHFVLILLYTVTLSWSCLLDPQLWVWMIDHISYLPQSSRPQGLQSCSGFFLHGDVCRIIPKMLLNFILNAQNWPWNTIQERRLRSSPAAGPEDFLQSFLSAVVSGSCPCPQLMKLNVSSTLGQSGMDSGPFTQSQQR